LEKKSISTYSKKFYYFTVQFLDVHQLSTAKKRGWYVGMQELYGGRMIKKENEAYK